MRSVTIFSDASYCAKSNIGAWACWIKTDGASAVVKGAAFREPTRDTLAAELMGIVNALAITKTAGWMLDAKVMIQCDSVNALQIVRHALGAADSPAPGGLATPLPKRLPKKRDDLAAIATVLQSVVDQQGATIIVRHVRGHQEGKGRQYVNRLVDQTARRAMRAKRREKAA
jgi:ribonuclease HI